MPTMAQPKPKFTTLGKSKFAHVVRTKAQDLKPAAKGGSGCQQVRKYTVAGKINYKSSLSADAALALDDCIQCHTHDVARSLMPKPTKEERQAKRDETLKKMADSRKTDGQRKREAKKAGKAPKEAKPGKKTKSGPRSVGGDDRSKAEALAAFGKEHGWTTGVDEANPGLVVTAVRGAETITCFFVDGKYDTTRHASVEVNGWTGKLRGVHGCRNQMAGEGRDRPHPNPGTGRSGPRKKDRGDEPDVPEDESPEDAHRRVPFAIDDDAVVIIDAVKGKTIRWRNGTSGAMEEAWLPGDAKGKKRSKIEIVDHPKENRRIIRFFTVTSITEHGEQYGPERSVFLDKITRVVG